MVSPRVSEITEELLATRRRRGKLEPPSSPGVYVIYLRDPSALLPFAPGPDGLVYVGSSSSLRDRELEAHFASGKTGFSTLRRSLGALLKQRLGLVPMPRGSGSSEDDASNYSFTEDGEAKLTDWMKSNLEVGFCVAPDREAAERGLIERLGPLLNLTGWQNPERKTIKKLRKACADEARAQSAHFRVGAHGRG